MQSDSRTQKVRARTLAGLSALALSLPGLAAAQVAPEDVGRTPPGAEGQTGAQGAQTGEPPPQTQAAAAQPIEDQARAKALLLQWFHAFEFVPSEMQMTRIAPEALTAALQAILADERLHPAVQARAVSSLVYAPDVAVEALLLTLVADGQRAESLRSKAALVLGEKFGAKHLAVLEATFEAADDDLHLREAIAQAIRKMGPEAHEVRERLWQREQSPAVRHWLSAEKNVQPKQPEAQGEGPVGPKGLIPRFPGR